LRHDSLAMRQKRRADVANRPGSAADLPRVSVLTKRAFDMTAAALLLVAASPILVVIALAIVVESRGGVFYRCVRIGQNGRAMRMLKFRKMDRGASGQALTVVNDGRFTRLGGLLARTKLDELPQLWNVLKGEMSLVGPRPEDPMFVERHAEQYDEILRVKPGITGLCQLAFTRESEVLDIDDPVDHYVTRLLPQKVDLDLLYARGRSMGMDLRILGWTAVATLLRLEVAVSRSSGKLSLRRRPNGFIAQSEAGAR
jgi:lipopolysaccharide/colanic/teichoic acid biosynthesis glycosyltransferase